MCPHTHTHSGLSGSNTQTDWVLTGSNSEANLASNYLCIQYNYHCIFYPQSIYCSLSPKHPVMASHPQWDTYTYKQTDTLVPTVFISSPQMDIQPDMCVDIYLNASCYICLTNLCLSLCCIAVTYPSSVHTVLPTPHSLFNTHSAAVRWPPERALSSGWTVTAISVILSEANIGTVPCLFNTCLTRLMTSILAINTVVRARTHTQTHKHTYKHMQS